MRNGRLVCYAPHETRMAEFTAEIVDQVVEICKTGADEAAEALARALDAEGLKLAVGEPGTPDSQELSKQLTGPGLVVVLAVGPSAALLVVPESSQLVPSWCADPDATGTSKLTTLAQELGMILLPEEFMPDDYKAVWLDDLADLLARAELSDESASVPLELSQSDKQGVAHLIWPALKPAGISVAEPAEPEPEAAAIEQAPEPPVQSIPDPAIPNPLPESQPRARHPGISVEDLPAHTRSLLRVKMPVVVTLAQKRQKLAEIVELGPGSMIQFDKSCEEMLELGVGDQPIALGEAVKVGDKFGLRVTSVILPEERFQAIRPPAMSGR